MPLAFSKKKYLLNILWVLKYQKSVLVKKNGLAPMGDKPFLEPLLMRDAMLSSFSAFSGQLKRDARQCCYGDERLGSPVSRCSAVFGCFRHSREVTVTGSPVLASLRTEQKGTERGPFDVAVWGGVTYPSV